MTDPEKLSKLKKVLEEELATVRRIRHDFAKKARIEPVWEGIVGQLGVEEKFILKLLAIIDGT